VLATAESGAAGLTASPLDESPSAVKNNPSRCRNFPNRRLNLDSSLRKRREAKAMRCAPSSNWSLQEGPQQMAAELGYTCPQGRRAGAGQGRGGPRSRN